METKRRRLPIVVIAAAVLALVVGIAGSATAGPDAFTSISKSKTKKIANKQAKKQINKQTPWGTDDIADGAISSSKLSDEAVKADELVRSTPGRTTRRSSPILRAPHRYRATAVRRLSQADGKARRSTKRRIPPFSCTKTRRTTKAGRRVRSILATSPVS